MLQVCSSVHGETNNQIYSTFRNQEVHLKIIIRCYKSYSLTKGYWALWAQPIYDI